MRTRRAFLPVAALAASLLVAGLSAGPALADSGPGGGTGPGGEAAAGGCAGQTCYSNIWSYAHISGTPGAYTTASGGGGEGDVAIPPAPCYMEPLFSGPEMYQLWKEGQGQRVGPGGTLEDQGLPAAQIKAHQNDTSGTWWSQVDVLSVPGTCNLPNYAWVTNGGTPPLPQLPGIDLADYAYDHLTLPSPALTINPSGQNYVSLPSYVWDTLNGGTSQQVSVTLGDETATLNATAGQLNLSVTGNGQVYSPCPAAGSHYPVGRPPANSGPGTTPDCGVVFSSPGTGDTIGAQLTWTVTSNYGNLKPIQVNGGTQVNVAEIQGLNS